jgi:hypothetical protein
LKKEKKVGAKVGKSKNFPVEILKTKKISGKNQKILKKIPGKVPGHGVHRLCRTGAMPSGTILRYYRTARYAIPRARISPLCPRISAGASPTQ